MCLVPTFFFSVNNFFFLTTPEYFLVFLSFRKKKFWKNFPRVFVHPNLRQNFIPAFSFEPNTKNKNTNKNVDGKKCTWFPYFVFLVNNFFSLTSRDYYLVSFSFPKTNLEKLSKLFVSPNILFP